MNLFSRIFSQSDVNKKGDFTTEKELPLLNVAKYNNVKNNLLINPLQLQSSNEMNEEKINEKKVNLPPFVYHAYVYFYLPKSVYDTIKIICVANKISRYRFFYEVFRWAIENKIKYIDTKHKHSKIPKEYIKTQIFLPYAFSNELTKIAVVQDVSSPLYRAFIVEKYIQSMFVESNGHFVYKQGYAPKKIYIADSNGKRFSV